MLQTSVLQPPSTSCFFDWSSRPSDSMRPDSWTKCADDEKHETRRPRDPCRDQSTHTEPLIHSKRA
uniref:Uncharacterized protein n=1 Tax=Astatotilapia calliptera TaxID=8154 RepID=A0AAX7SCQ8_ASTCA